ncbi:MAG: hypothetical protein ACOC22_04585 [bacterium]
MNTQKFKMLCDGQFVGFIFITDKNPKVPGFKLATIWPLEKQGSWTTGDLELTGRKHIVDAFPIEMTDEQIQENLIKRTNIRNNCTTFSVDQAE